MLSVTRQTCHTGAVIVPTPRRPTTETEQRENDGIILELYYEIKHLPRPHGSHIPKWYILPNVTGGNYSLQLPVFGLLLELGHGFTLLQHNGHLCFGMNLETEPSSTLDIYPFVKVLTLRYPSLS